MDDTTLDSLLALAEIALAADEERAWAAERGES